MSGWVGQGEVVGGETALGDCDGPGSALGRMWAGLGLEGECASVRDGMGWGGGVAGGEWAIGGGETRWVVCGG